MNDIADRDAVRARDGHRGQRGLGGQHDDRRPKKFPHYAGRAGVNVQLDKSQTVWPIRPTPAVNRGYRKGFLREDGSLKEFTAACGPCVYRGGLFPDDCDGDVFVCEPAARRWAAIRHSILRCRYTLTFEPRGDWIRDRWLTWPPCYQPSIQTILAPCIRR